MKCPPDYLALERLVDLLVNREVALDRVGGDRDLLAEIARLFLEDYPRIIAEIASAIENRNPTALEHAAHSLKGSVGNFGADSAWQQAFELEKIGRSGDLSKAPAAFAALNAIFDALRPELEALSR